jgi:hypothetical protein
MNILPTTCPSCSSQLNVKSLVCQRCQTEIQGQYELPLLARLSTDDEDFVLEFIKASGSLKEMAKLFGLSYPTVRNRLDEIIELIKFTEKDKKDGKEKKL